MFGPPEVGTLRAQAPKELLDLVPLLAARVTRFSGQLGAQLQGGRDTVDIRGQFFRGSLGFCRRTVS